MKRKPFKQLVFYHCYDLGWGEKGVLDTCLTFDQAAEIIAEVNPERVKEWLDNEDHRYEYRMDYYIISSRVFVEQDWVQECPQEW